MNEIRALVFDVFGTVVDWRGSLIRELKAFGKARGVSADWAGLADAWRGAYQPSIRRVLKGEEPWCKLEVLQRRSLEDICSTRGLSKLTSDELDEINRFWRHCRPWPDSVHGLKRLKADRVVAALSNGDVALLVEMAKRGGLAWDMVLSTELFRSFKPHPSTYLGACGLLGLEPGQVMMCAAHEMDLAAARKLGLRTAYIARPKEYGPVIDASPTQAWDYSVESLIELAERLEH